MTIKCKDSEFPSIDIKQLRSDNSGGFFGRCDNDASSGMKSWLKTSKSTGENKKKAACRKRKSDLQINTAGLKLTDFYSVL